MQQASKHIELVGRGRGFTDITATLSEWVAASGIRTGILTAFVPHTSASLVIQENADPNVRGDLEAFFAKLVPDDDPVYRHKSEGGDDMPSHIRSALTQTQVSVPVDAGTLTLGTWQSVYFWEHRTQPRKRHLLLHLIGE
tara:strand:- start:2 stop:421 length:420 start_codon:yes stop_codon:yes gene_type:complete